MGDEWDWDSDAEENGTETLSRTSNHAMLESQYQEEDILMVMNELKELQTDMIDPSVRESLNGKLHRAAMFDKFVEYYEKSEKLGHYTIETELHRNEFIVKCEDGHEERGRLEIVDMFKNSQHKFIWRFANQSIWAEILIALQSSHFFRQDLSISIVSTQSRFVIDLSGEGMLLATSNFMIMTATSRNYADASSPCLHGKLSLGEITGEVVVDLNKRVVRLSLPHPPVPNMVLDPDLRLASISILEMRNQIDEVEKNGESDINHRLGIIEAVGVVNKTSNAILENVVLGVGKALGVDKRSCNDEGMIALLNHVRTEKEQKCNVCTTVDTPPANEINLASASTLPLNTTYSQCDTSEMSQAMAADEPIDPPLNSLFGIWTSAAKKLGTLATKLPKNSVSEDSNSTGSIDSDSQTFPRKSNKGLIESLVGLVGTIVGAEETNHNKFVFYKKDAEESVSHNVETKLTCSDVTIRDNLSEVPTLIDTPKLHLTESDEKYSHTDSREDYCTTKLNDSKIENQDVIESPKAHEIKRTEEVVLRTRLKR